MSRRFFCCKRMYSASHAGRVWFLVSFIAVCYLLSYVKDLLTFDPDRPRFCCTVFQGGLGNLLFQYAFSYAVARDKNLTLVVTASELKELQEVFEIPTPMADSRAPRFCRRATKLEDKVDVGLDPNLLHLPNNTDLRFEGYFQSWVYWRDYERDLREQIKLHPSIIATANQLIDEQLARIARQREKVTLVGIHIRRGDMITNDYYKKYGYQVADETYLKNAMKYVSERVKGEIVFVVCSNDMVWAKKAINVPNAVFVSGTKRQYDMAALTLCDHFIMTVGTFGWWTGFLSRGIIVYYNAPFRPGTDLAKNFAADYQQTFFLQHWVGMS